MAKTSANKRQNYGTGRRKTCTARVFIKRGTGKVTVNRKNLDIYFGRPTARMMVLQPLELVGLPDKFDVTVTVKGGGVMGQAGAIRHGLVRALIQYDEETKAPKSAAAVELDEKAAETSFRRILRKAGIVTRDARKVERKKPGFHKARRSPQFSKR